jgi:hypothetical protein
MDIVRKMPGTSLLVTFILGLGIGLVALGWWLFPVEYTGATPSGLFPEYQAIYVRNVAELYSFDNNQEKVRAALGGWGGDAVACELAASSTDLGDQQRLNATAAVINGTGCTAVGTAPGSTDTGTTTDTAATDEGNNWLLPLLLLALLALLGGAAYYVYNRRQEIAAEAQAAPVSAYRPTTPPRSTTPAARPAESAAGVNREPQPEYEPVAVPIARFRTHYTFGHDTYDDSFSIENNNGEFMGECGVGISEVLGTGSPKAVTALEVWLFDKNDIRTITKVIMSDHAFFDEALKAKLAPKGEPVLARENETIVLETASLIINAEITDMAYGNDPDLPDRSYFDLFTIELSAWSKEGEVDQAAGNADDIMNY